MEAGAFHEGRAKVRVWANSVAEDMLSQFHICEDGTPAYGERYIWVGDFMNGRARAIKWVANAQEEGGGRRVAFDIDRNGKMLQSDPDEEA
jgi:hypothetical protein